MLKLLCIDDNQSERLLVRLAVSLEKIPFLVFEADSPDSAASFFAPAHALKPGPYPCPDVVLLDYNLGESTGGDFLDWLRLEKGLNLIPVIMFSGFCGRRHIAECYAKGANYFICKPGTLPRLKKIIQAVYLSTLNTSPSPLTDLREYFPKPPSPNRTPRRNIAPSRQEPTRQRPRETASRNIPAQRSLNVD